MRKKPVDVFCPACFASPGQTCRVVLLRGRGKPCRPHAKRRLKAGEWRMVRT